MNNCREATKIRFSMHRSYVYANTRLVIALAYKQFLQSAHGLFLAFCAVRKSIFYCAWWPDRSGTLVLDMTTMSYIMGSFFVLRETAMTCIGEWSSTGHLYRRANKLKKKKLRLNNIAIKNRGRCTWNKSMSGQSPPVDTGRYAG